MMKFNFSRKTVVIFFAFFAVNFSLFAQPANDNPCDIGVPLLTVGSTCVYTNSTNVNATETVGPPYPACAGFLGASSPANNDVWFSTTVTASGSIKVTLRSGGMTDSGMALYTGTSCNALTLISCNDDGPSNLMSEISAISLTPGSTVWIRVWAYSGSIDGTFDICVKEIAAPPAMPNCGNNSVAGDECAAAPPICNLNGYCGNTSGFYTSSASTWPGIETAFSCGGIQNDSYISFVASSSTVTLYAWVTSGDPLLGVQMMIFSSPSCGSGTPISYTCIGQMQPSAIPYEVSASGLTVGTTYYLLIDGYSNDICDYVIGVPSIGGGLDLPVNVTPITASICAGNSISITATGGSGSYDWSTSPSASTLMTTNTAVVTTNVLSVIGTYTYTVVSNSSSTCPSNSTSIITVIAAPTETTGSSTICIGTTTQLSNLTFGGVWSSLDPSRATVDATGLVTGVSAGPCTIRYVVCGIDKDLLLTVNASPIVDPITGINTICNGSSTTFSSITSGGVWTSGNLSCATIDPTTGVVSTVGVGTSLITYTVTANGCSTPKTITLTVNAMPVVQPITGLDKVCVGSTITMVEPTLAGTWISSSPVNATIDASGIVTGVFTGQTAITYSKTVLGCTTISPAVIVDVNPLPIVSPITGNSSFCIFSSLDLADLTLGGIWSSSSLGIATVDPASGRVTGVSGGVSVITYTVTNQVSGCTDKQTKTITVIDQPRISINYSVLADNKTCLFQVPDTLFLDQNTGGGLAAGNWTYELPKTTATANVLAPTSLNTGIVVSDYGIYKFTYTEPTCNDEATIILNVTPQVYGKLETYYPLCKDASLELTVVDISNPEYLESLVWNTGATTNSITVSEGGIYTATLRNVCNPDGLVLPSLVDIKICDIDMPNVFTPNGDGVNDVYHINGEKDIFKEFNIVIVNRWGNVIVSYNDPKGTWDGKNSSNQFVDEGVYFYTVKAVTLQGKELVKQGFVHVVAEN